MLVGWRRDPLTCRQLQTRDGRKSKLRDKGILNAVFNIIDVIAYSRLPGTDVWEQTSTGRWNQERAVRTRNDDIMATSAAKKKRVVWAVESCCRWTDLRSSNGRFFQQKWCLRERRLQDESSEILFDVSFAHTTSADTFSNELTEVATDV